MNLSLLFLFFLIISESSYGDLFSTDKDAFPLEIDADSIEYISDSTGGKAYAYGTPNAIATKGTRTVQSPEMIATFVQSKESDEGQVLTFIEANQGVVATEGPHTLIGEKGTFDVEQELLTVTGERVLFQTPDETLEAHESLTYQEKTHLLTATKEVSFQNRESVRANCDHSIAHLIETSEGKNEIREAELFGIPSKGVVFEDKKNPEKPILAHGNNAYYRLKDEGIEIFLLGNGVLVQGSDTLTAPCIWIRQDRGKPTQETIGRAVPCETLRPDLPPTSALLTTLPLQAPQRAKAVFNITSRKSSKEKS